MVDTQGVDLKGTHRELAIARVAARRGIPAQDITWEEFEQSDLRQYAVFKASEVLEEAARLISDEVRRAHPQIPWEQIAGMRNRPIHEYFRIDLPTVWRTIRDEISPLIAQIEPLVPPEQP